MAPLTWGADTIRQGQEWSIQGPTGVPQNWVAPVNKGHGFRVPATLLEVKESGMGKGALRTQKASGLTTLLFLDEVPSFTPECP